MAVILAVKIQDSDGDRDSVRRVKTQSSHVSQGREIHHYIYISADSLCLV